jgi:ABC-type amino acid transport system permease subunit
MVRAIPILILVACTIYTAVHIVQANSERIRVLPKSMWLVVTLLVPGLGVLAYWLFGRALHLPAPPPIAPDDDPDFLRGL